MQMKSKLNKAGVSLIAVLLFMLVATIAATATWKWITSEGKSSASRMLKREAYQSAVAGIENARAWMTYHGNDLGALIKQYFDNGNRPIKLNDQLTPWVQGKQNYDVWLTGVNAGSAHNFKLKILSRGTSRNNSEHTEVAIFNVDGLYQMTIPAMSIVLDFDKAFSGSVDGDATNSPTLESALINGDFSGNQPSVTRDLVVTGNVVLQGTTTAVGGDLYVKGNASFNSNTQLGAPGRVAYVGGSITSCEGGYLSSRGDLLVEGDYPANCAVDADGNLTIGGTLYRGSGTYNFYVAENLVFKETGMFNWASDAVSALVPEENTVGVNNGVRGSTYLANISGQNSDDKRIVSLGNPVYLYESFPATIHYCQNGCKKNGVLSMNDCANRCGRWDKFCEGFFTSCEVVGSGFTAANVGLAENRYFSFRSDVNGRVSDNRVHSWSRSDPVLKNIGGRYWTNIEKMNAYGNLIKEDNKIPQPVLLKDVNVWSRKIANAHCRTLGYTWADKQEKNEISREDLMNDNAQKVFKALNDCWQRMTNDGDNTLYNGFMIVKFAGDATSSMKHQVVETMNGKFVFYFESRMQDAFYLPPTTESSAIMFYAQNGGGTLMSAETDATHPGPYVYNYFIFSDGTSDSRMNFSNIQINGSVVMANDSKAKIADGGVNLLYNGEVLSKLAEAGLIEQNPEFGSDDDAAGAAIGVAGQKDAYYIATAPQIHVSLVSRSESSESVPAANAADVVDGSFIVLPRVIFLPKNPYGKLSDYFNVVNLNGANEQKNMSNVECGAGIPVDPDLLYNRAAAAPQFLVPNLYECTYTSNSKSIPFYIRVQNALVGSQPPVHFETDYENMSGTDTKYLKLVYESTSTADAFDVTISKPSSAIANWTLTPDAAKLKAGTTCTETDAQCTFTLHFDNASPATLFTVATSGATEGTALFQITDCSGCQADIPSAESFQVASSVIVNRSSISAYCGVGGPGANTDDCKPDGVYYEMSQIGWPECPATGTWVRAAGTGDATNNCVAKSTHPNDSWTCESSGNIGLVVDASEVPEGCTAVVPSYSLGSPLTPNMAYTLYGSLKRNKVNFHVGFRGDYAGKSVTVTSSRLGGTQVCLASSDGCDYALFAGDKITLKADDTDFSYWDCDTENSTNCTSEEMLSGETLEFEAVSGNNSVDAWFLQKDKHCFFDEFKTSRECVGGDNDNEWKYCFDYCNSSENCGIGDGAFSGFAKWLVIGNSELRNKIQYQGGKIWLEDYSYIRGKKQSDRGVLKILSSVNAGLYGSMRAQFQAPRLVGNDNKSVDESGFMLRSDNQASAYIRLNIFVNATGHLEAKVCIGDNCQHAELIGNGRVGNTEVVTMTATIRSAGGSDLLDIETITGYYGNFKIGMTSFELSRLNGFSGFTTNTNEYVGFILSDPDFKLYDIGWKSDSYNKECWDAYPTVKCSFKDAYLGGIVPKDTITRPWVGLSSWFDKKACTTQYWYNGGDACDRQNDGVYYECSSNYYVFDEDGSHGVENTVNGETVETNMAMAMVQNCAASLSDENMALLYAERAKCGAFWVGEIRKCSEKLTVFDEATPRQVAVHTNNTDVGTYAAAETFTVGGTSGANMRSAKLLIHLTNEGASEVEIYLRSGIGDNALYSKSAYTTSNGLVTINVDDLSKAEGFNPEHVTGVIVRNLGPDAIYVVKIETNCDNIPKLTCKDVMYDAGKFKVTVEAKNTKYVSSYSVTATENDQSNSALNVGFNCDEGNCPQPDAHNNIVFNTPDYNPYTTSGAKDYVFTVNMKVKKNGVEENVEGSPCTVSRSISDITAGCQWRNYAETAPYSLVTGSGFPPFQYRLVCPEGKTCPYEILFDGTKIYENSGSTNGFVDLPPDAKKDINTPTNPLTVGNNSHTVTFRSASNDVVFTACTKSFVVTAKPADPVTCSISAQTSPAEVNASGLGGSVAIPKNMVTVNNCGTSNCKYTIKKGPADAGSTNTYSSEYDLSFTGSNEAGVHDYEVFVQRGTEPEVKCGNYKVKFPLNLKCGSFTDPGAESPVDAGTSINPPSPSIDVSGTVSGCNGKCKYTVSGVTGVHGNNYDGTSSISSFKDDKASGEKNYTLTVSHGEGDKQASITCPFTVTYKGSSSTSTGSINCSFSATTINLGESFVLTPNYGGTCYNGNLKLGSTEISNQCISTSLTITPETSGTLTYTYSVTSGSASDASCSANITVNDVVVTGSVTISSKDDPTDVPCRKSISVSTTTYENNETWLHCTGSFNKTVGSNSADQHNEAKVKVCNGHGHGNSETSCTGTFETECLPGRTMSCTVKGP
ncbi:pilus assembly PilX N-terminal domain-containing protein [Candidatus Saccharibacteria bacterium]|nr:pilus assembly PilX N-terminal domain-containing protein [Candidatus Saccharibacteria bacterium]